jgi:hypothetical protein
MGRRKLAIFGGLAMATPHLIMAGIVGKYSGSWASHKGIGWFGVALICKLRGVIDSWTSRLTFERLVCAELRHLLWPACMDVAGRVLLDCNAKQRRRPRYGYDLDCELYHRRDCSSE